MPCHARHTRPKEPDDLVLTRWLPVDPLMDVLDRRARDHGYASGQAYVNNCFGHSSAESRALLRGRQRGELTWTSAERWADRLGLHPSEIWLEWHTALVA